MPKMTRTKKRILIRVGHEIIPLSSELRKIPTDSEAKKERGSKHPELKSYQSNLITPGQALPAFCPKSLQRVAS